MIISIIRVFLETRPLGGQGTATTPLWRTPSRSHPNTYRRRRLPAYRLQQLVARSHSIWEPYLRTITYHPSSTKYSSVLTLLWRRSLNCHKSIRSAPSKEQTLSILCPSLYNLDQCKARACLRCGTALTNISNTSIYVHVVGPRTSLGPDRLFLHETFVPKASLRGYLRG